MSCSDPRRPLPAEPIEAFEIGHPDLPPAAAGMRVLHVSDPHVRRPRAAESVIGRLIAALPALETDLVVLTGDYMDSPGEELAALGMLEAMAAGFRARLGAFGIFGNHDTPAFARLAVGISGITWLNNEVVDLPEAGVRLVGTSFPEDLLGALVRAPAGEGLFPIALVHYPTELYAARTLGLPMVLAGHTHGGQVRLTPTLAPHTSSDLPMNRASGLLRLDRTLCAISRGLGEGVIEARLNCRAQVPLYTLRRAALPGPDRPGELVQAMRW